MRELDILLEGYLRDAYPAADEAEKASFRRFLTLSDPQLAGYLLRQVPSDDPLTACVINRILDRAADQ
jgi:succinate dehydrogenase flavin-adding protein (antitoxin of CptAB toxin-antitoxin module)